MTGLNVSVVIPYYNGSSFLKEALDMVMRQSLPPTEIVIVDDGSDEENMKYAVEVSAKFPNVKLCRQSNGGPGVARNRGVSEGSGDLFAFLDVDDDWDENKLEKQVSFFNLYPETGIVLTECETISDVGEVEFRSNFFARSRSAIIESILRGRLHSFTSAVMVTRNFFDEVGGFEPALRFREDHLFLLRGFLLDKVSVIPEALSRRRMHLNSMSSAGTNLNPRLSLERAELFWREASAFMPNLPLNALRANEMIRLARKYIVLTETTKAIDASIRAFLLEPSHPRHLAYIFAAIWGRLQPGRFDKWHSGFAQIRDRKVNP